MIIIYPWDEDNNKQPDIMFSDEYHAAKAAGLDCRLICPYFDAGVYSDKWTIKSGDKILYRGWMLNEYDYDGLSNSIERHGATLITSKEEYFYAHHLPNWYNDLKDFTFETIVCEKDSNFNEVLKDVSWNKFFIKDYVKSLNTACGPVAKGIIDIPFIIKAMEKYRGEVEGGIVIREFEELHNYCETRFFVVNGKLCYDSDAYDKSRKSDKFLEFINSIVSAVGDKSNFYSIDCGLNYNGEYRLIEIGDGQVSDMKKWEIDRFVEILKLLDT